MATNQFMGVPDSKAPEACEAGVVALKTHTIPVAEAIAQSLAALEWMLEQGCRQILFKCCLTFDSTPQGDIGPVAEALMARLQLGSTVVCPAFPATGRLLFNGHLFVNRMLLSETGMKDHPLTPMSDPNIVRWLQKQSTGTVGLIAHDVVGSGASAISKGLDNASNAGQNLIVVDATSDDDLRAIGHAVAKHKLVTGGSGIAMGLPANFGRQGLLAGATAFGTGLEGPGVVLSGSCSSQSLSQVAAYAQHYPALPIFPDDLIRRRMTVQIALEWVMEHIEDGPMVYSTADAATVRRAQERHGRDRIAGLIEQLMAELACEVTEIGVTRLVVGGGETSGAVVSALKIRACTIGPEIDPGIPALIVQGHPLMLALKSGNFGEIDFFDKALKALSV